MCEYTGASCRLGSIVETIDDRGDKAQITVSKAQEIGRQISSRLGDYLAVSIDAVKGSLEDFGSALGLTELNIVEQESGSQIRARFEPGLILDFPKITIDANGRSIQLRSCVTVCVGPLRSKLWTRANTLGDWGSFSDKELVSLHGLLESCLLYTSPSPRDRTRSRMPSSA